MNDWLQERRDTAPPSAPDQLYVDPAFRPESSVEPRRGIFVVGIAAIIAVGIAMAASALVRNERPAMASVEAARPAEAAIAPAAPSPSSPPAVPLIPPISASAPAASPSIDAPPAEKVAAPASVPETSTQEVTMRDDHAKPRRQHRDRPALAAQLKPRGDGPPIDAADLPPLDADAPRNAN